jgi:hypothetical protein
MFGKNLKIDPGLLKRCKACAEKAGYVSTDEFIQHVLERACQASESGKGETEEEITMRLRGLGSGQ